MSKLKKLRKLYKVTTSDLEGRPCSGGRYGIFNGRAVCWKPGVWKSKKKAVSPVTCSSTVLHAWTTLATAKKYARQLKNPTIWRAEGEVVAINSDNARKVGCCRLRILEKVQ